MKARESDTLAFAGGDPSDAKGRDDIDALMANPQALARLLDEHRILKEAIEHSPIPYCVYDENDCLLALNDAYIGIYSGNSEATRLLEKGAGVSYADVRRALLRDKVPAEKLEAAVRDSVYAQRYAVGKPIERDYGEHGVFNVVKYRLPSGAVGGMAVDISTLKQREQELAQARRLARANERTNATLIANMGGGVRAGLTQIMESCSRVQADRSNVVALEDLKERCTALLALMDELLDVSQADSGDSSLNEENLVLTGLIDSAAVALMPFAAERNVILDIREVSRALSIYADPRAFKQIIVHLTSAAIENTPPGGKVTLSASLTVEEEIALVVEDTGAGISKSDLDAFHSRASTDEVSQDGLWQSLAVVQSLAELHFARFDLSSSAGRGTRGTVLFPATRTLQV